MKYLLKILSYLFLLILFTSEDCSNEVHQPSVYEQQQTLFGELESNLTGTVLEEDELIAMMQRVEQKFNELTDYINICSDTTVNVEFRLEARKMISKFFVSESDMQGFLSVIDLQEDTIRHFLFNPAYEPGRVIVSSVVDLQKFASTGTGDYTGDISYKLSCATGKFEGLLGVVLKKVPKQFGDDSLVVWEQFFKL